MKYRLLIALLIGLSLAPADALGGAADISGTWALVYETRDGGHITVTFAFKQQGGKLTGDYSGPFGEHKVTGTVKGDKAVFGFDVKGPGDKPTATANLSGTIESTTRMTGTVGSPFCGGGCKWVATRKKK
jgi:hypothetical protein